MDLVGNRFTRDICVASPCEKVGIKTQLILIYDLSVTGRCKCGTCRQVFSRDNRVATSFSIYWNQKITCITCQHGHGIRGMNYPCTKYTFIYFHAFSLICTCPLVIYHT